VIIGGVAIPVADITDISDSPADSNNNSETEEDTAEA
jgi:hypothetical protein